MTEWEEERVSEESVRMKGGRGRVEEIDWTREGALKLGGNDRR